jgi:hypothetical protein
MRDIKNGAAGAIATPKHLERANTGANVGQFSVNGNGVEHDLTEGILEEISKTENQQHAFDLVLQQCKIDPSEEINDAPICLEFHGKNGPAIVGTYGNFSAVIGKAKSRKTFLVSLILSSFITLRLFMGRIKAVVQGQKNKILLFDTEQSKFHLQKVVKRILLLAGNSNAENFEAYCLRTFDPKTRLGLMKWKIENTPDAALVVIDGIRDVVFDINDAKEATDIVTDLMRLSEEMGVHIIVVIHQNKNDNNARGHLGTEIINKAESVLQVSKDSNNDRISIVEAERCREKEFDPFAFTITEEGMPEILGDWLSAKQTETDGKRVRKSANHIDDDFHKDRLKEAFSIDRKPSYGPMWRNVKTAFLPFQKIADNDAKDFVSYYQQKGWISKTEPPESGKAWPVYRSALPV